jgi:hypothetical protein
VQGVQRKEFIMAYRKKIECFCKHLNEEVELMVKFATNINPNFQDESGRMLKGICDGFECDVGRSGKCSIPERECAFWCVRDFG